VDDHSVKLVSQSNAAHADRVALTAASTATLGVVATVIELVSDTALATTVFVWAAIVSQPESTTHLTSSFITSWLHSANAVTCVHTTAATHA